MIRIGKNRGGVQFYGNRGEAFDPDALALFARMATNGSEPDAARKLIINQLILDLKGLGTTGSADIWTKLDVLQVYAAATEIQALTSWKNSNSLADPIKVNTPTFTANEGFSSTTLNNRIESNWIANTHAVNYQLNDASIGGYFPVVNEATYFMGNLDINLVNFRGANGSSRDANMNSHFIINVNFGSLSGLFWHDRNNSTNFQSFTNATQVASSNRASSSVPSNEILVPYALGSGGTNTVSLVFAGASIQADNQQFYDSIIKYINAV